MSEDDHNKTIMIRRNPASEAEPPPSAVQPATKPEAKKVGASGLKSPFGIVGVIIALAVAAFVLLKLTGK